MRCIDCPYHSRLLGQDWCDIGKTPKRISYSDSMVDVPCSKLLKKEKKAYVESNI